MTDPLKHGRIVALWGLTEGLRVHPRLRIKSRLKGDISWINGNIPRRRPRGLR